MTLLLISSDRIPTNTMVCGVSNDGARPDLRKNNSCLGSLDTRS